MEKSNFFMFGNNTFEEENCIARSLRFSAICYTILLFFNTILIKLTLEHVFVQWNIVSLEIKI